ncbi:hypothetical protein F5144DRAFT_169802 [Chaetomium tenue]|uniref:Uncharacterized protein n=1 Tax=Chaetomium tenue TaxID=1854479 RepID=A0ACB7PBB5_9PEZI|nr:hypothetical protein F5144DRAFT_169802 [Chaetomium globosum]
MAPSRPPPEDPESSGGRSCTFLAGRSAKMGHWVRLVGRAAKSLLPGHGGMVPRGVWASLAGLGTPWCAGSKRQTLRGSTKLQMRQLDTAFQVFRGRPPRWSAIPCAALIGVAAKASTIRHGSVRTHLKLMLPGYAAGDGMADACFRCRHSIGRGQHVTGGLRNTSLVRRWESLPSKGISEADSLLSATDPA